MRLYNSLSREVEEFVPLDPNCVSLYVCGPTVYDTPHLGNARPAIVFDVLRNVLSLRHRVRYARNVTDIDDKIIAAAHANEITIGELTTDTYADYAAVCQKLHCLPPSDEPHATRHIGDMIALIERLIAKGHAYVAESHVLFELATFAAHGVLSRQSQEDLIANHRVEFAPYKRAQGDFVLWKPSDKRQPGWPSPWGTGRPGWHIECSAMIQAIFGETIDIHGGGNDLRFPHHECEITQSMAANGAPLARYWLHNGMVLVNGRKMAKSEGNFITVREALAQYPGEAIRLALLQTHYRSPLDWTGEAIDSSRQILSRWYRRIEPFSAVRPARNEWAEPVIAALEDDLNTPKALLKMHRLFDALFGADDKRPMIAGLLFAADLLGVLQKVPLYYLRGEALDGEVRGLFDTMDRARAAGDYVTSDRLRDRLKGMGLKIENYRETTMWRRE